MKSYVIDLECTYPGCDEKYCIDEINKLKEIIKKIRNKARAIADYDTSDFIRDELTKLGYEIQDKD